MPAHKTSDGFSVIELVIVIVVIGIITGVAMARALRSDTYNPALARDQIIAMSRSAQQKSIGRSDVVLQLQPTGSALAINILDSTGLVQSASPALANVGLRGDINVLGSCSVVAGGADITQGNPFILRYDSLGDLLEGGPANAVAAVSKGARACINGDPALSVCWSAAGFAYAGDCVDVD
ncbi:MAG: prepilin-type N-terminal cleavage/methylation domain-containing protein [Pseudohongiella sp.]|nr:prepilin-type N-terminal cleavage/methylation domain-containing protein [Pseudohongiella sp.]MDO9520462.1 prepilin-type N-terminal cleavage/methylation domain-containing protein [Pseudohongiella sp.]